MDSGYRPDSPDWVVLGTPTADGKVAVYASRDLTHAELCHERDELTWGHWTREMPRRIELTVGMRTYVVITADTYELAFRVLFDTWSPDGAGERPAIAAGRRQISDEGVNAGASGD